MIKLLIGFHSTFIFSLNPFPGHYNFTTITFNFSHYLCENVSGSKSWTNYQMNVNIHLIKSQIK